MVHTILKNRHQPDMPSIPVSFPIKNYTKIYESLHSIGIGSATIPDCFITELSGDYPILKRLTETEVNVDELDYLVKRLESFNKYEVAQFQGTAVSQDFFNMEDFINLTFYCKHVTVVQDFTDLTAVGRTHYMNLHGGMNEDDLKIVDFQKTALSLLLNEEGTITPYGVVYGNGMRMELYYNGLYFPDYRHSDDALLTVAVTDKNLPEDTRDIVWLYLPVEDCQIERALMRTGIQEEEVRLCYTDSQLPDVLVDILGSEENLYELNKLCCSIQELDSGYREKLEAALQMSKPSFLTQAQNLIKWLNLFDFIPGVSNPEEYGRYMIMESGYFEYDSELDQYYEFKKYGEHRIENEYGQFIANGYVSYQGFISIDEVMAGSESERMENMMGGMEL
ncbi:MAG: antirestriction protein ArdA [Hungatella sp.]|jgi:hypothetical protein|nr:antirestriction protein ArdA [Hungatella sp.]